MQIESGYYSFRVKAVRKGELTVLHSYVYYAEDRAELIKHQNAYIADLKLDDYTNIVVTHTINEDPPVRYGDEYDYTF